jgi:hypothetical protein
MGIKLEIMKPQEVEAKYVTVDVKACDEGSYELIGADDNLIAERSEDYVPNDIIPGDYGDYIRLKIDIKTGQIVNWKEPTPQQIREAFGLSGGEE